jgi:hypothetical protein
VRAEPRRRRPLQSFSVAADRRFGAIEGVLGATWLAEDASVLGARFADTLGLAGADTLFLDAGAALDLAPGWRAGAAWRQGWTRVREGGLFTPGSVLATSGWSFDVTRAGVFASDDSVGLRLAQPLRVSAGVLGLRLPVAYDYATLQTSYGTQSLSLAPTGREIDAELAWSGPLWGGSASGSLFYRSEPGHYANRPADKGVALRWKKSF